ncbi:unannotated protein [freshwater metagenome]|uniref:Unannotated protein n=1 Tax=freshwater metagenome TaxID=449393 RepID=A0A6J6Q5I3_9ZZZZ
MPDQFNAFVVGPATWVPGRPGGPLTGLTVAVKDVIDVAGLPTRHGLCVDAAPAGASAAAVAAVVAAGATCVGKTATDQLAFGLSGLDTAGAAPRNPRHEDRLPGGSSSGAAAAVAGGLVDVAIGTDTAGSVRVPASYCSIVGFRPTHGSVSVDGVAALAPDFDTVGWLASSVHLAQAVGDVLLPDDTATVTTPTELLLLVEALDALDPADAAGIRRGVTALAQVWGVPVRSMRLGSSVAEVGAAFRGDQLAQIAARHPAVSLPAGLVAAVRERFDQAHAGAAGSPTAARIAARSSLEPLLAALAGGAVLALPAAAGPAPRLEDVTSASYAEHRATTVALNAIAGLLGAPSLVLPTPADDASDAPGVGLALVAAPGADRMLLAAAGRSELPDAEIAPLGSESLRSAFYDYEAAFVRHDLAALSDQFAPGPSTIRFAPDGAAYGRTAIDARRAAAPSAAQPRDVVRLTFSHLGPDVGVTALEYQRASGVRGLQTQTWQRRDGRWRVVLAHVSLLGDVEQVPISAGPVPTHRTTSAKEVTPR